MAKMIPPYIHRDIKSFAEKKIFMNIKEDDALEDWLCFHSLGLSRHNSKVCGEIDFLLVGRWGIICLEVKGGSVKRDKGTWTFTDRFGRQMVKRESPFEQALTGTMSLRADLVRKLGRTMEQHRFGYGVIFPDIEFEQQSPEWDSDLVYDLRDRTNPFSKYLKRITLYWENKLKGDKQDLSKENLFKIRDYLRGNFERLVPLWVRVEESEESLVALTENQFGALDSMSNNRRVLFKGPAGTGKTLLAVEQAKRLAAEKKKVLFICFNVFLSKKLEAMIRTDHIDNYVKVVTIHKLFYDTIKKSSYFDEFEKAQQTSDQDKLFDVLYPEYFIKSVERLKEEPFDALIIDEGQDVLRRKFFAALNIVLCGGLKTGQWCIFYDSNNQGRLYNNFDENLISELSAFGVATYNLNVNCRNTKPIAIQTSVISGFKMAKTLLDSGERVEYSWYEERNELGEKVDALLSRLLNGGINCKDITVLYPGGDNDLKASILSSKVKSGIKEMTIDDFEFDNDNSIKACSIQAYKGLENKVVILAGMERMYGDWIDTLNYVGMSRARNLLFCLFDKKLQNKYQEKTKGFIESFG